ncbi:MAG: TGS domain-containing protein, partial [Pseudomonadota bacterium]
REELEDLSFSELNPDARASLIRRSGQLRERTGGRVPEIVDAIRVLMDEEDIRAEVLGRQKKPFSIWRKMEEKKIAFSQLSDIYAFRVLCDDERDCYRALGALHRHWRAVPGRFKDYVSSPKANGYRSLHTTVSGPEALRVEVQIRTHEMHMVAESGVAAHWSYRDGHRVETRFAVEPQAWLQNLVARIEKGDEPAEFLEHVRLEMYTDQVFCFTPKGDVIGLPRGATPLDFAYAIHTNVGDRCAGANVDGTRLPLFTRLRNGQEVEIITADGQQPSPHWEDLVTTGRAKHAIRRSLREQRREAEVLLGREIAGASFARLGREATDKTYGAVAAKLGQPSTEALLRALAHGRLTGRQVVEAVYPTPPEAFEPEPDLPPSPGERVLGVPQGFATSFCQRCWPLPGERIIGLRRRGDIGVHAASCSVLAAYEDELARWHDLRWAPDAAQRPASLARIAVWMANEPGVLGRVCTLIGEQRANIDNFAVVDRQPEVYRITLDLEVRDLRHLSDLLTALEAQVFVRRAERKRDLPETTANPQPRLPLAPTDGSAVPASLETRAPADPAGAAVSAPAGRGTKSGAAASPARD